MSGPDKLRVAILISGRGSNMAAIARACASGRLDARIVGVIADRPNAGGIALAHSLGLETAVIPVQQFAQREAFEAALVEVLTHWQTQLVALAGFMRVLSTPFVRRHSGQMVNIHPSLLPRHKGLQTHRRVLQAAEREHGASVHYVTPELDDGPVIYQGRVAVLPGDTEESLAARVQGVEHRIYPATIGLIAAGRVRFSDGAVLLDGRVLATPLRLEVTDAPAT